MRDTDLEALLATASDAAVVVDTDGVIQYANPSAEKLFAASVQELKGRFCYRVVRGVDQSSLEFCCAACPVREIARTGCCPPSFDFQIQTPLGSRWNHVTLLLARNHTGSPYQVIHLLHDIHSRMQLQEATRTLLQHVASLTGHELEQLLSFSPKPHPELTEREQLVLDCLARGNSTRAIAREIGLSVPTIRNHIQAILRKLSAHSRLQAVMRAVRDKRI